MLNAFRRQRTDHTVEDIPADLSSECSTPFGVRGRITGSRSCSTRRRASAQRLSASEDGSRAFRCLTRTSRCGAQRLSASEDGSQDTADNMNAARGCSTPFGVRGRITHFQLLPLTTPLVLNAFRRQRTDHSSPDRSQSTRCGAQRLSASEDGSLRRLPTLSQTHYSHRCFKENGEKGGCFLNPRTFHRMDASSTVSISQKSGSTRTYSCIKHKKNVLNTKIRVMAGFSHFL